MICFWFFPSSMWQSVRMFKTNIWILLAPLEREIWPVKAPLAQVFSKVLLLFYGGRCPANKKSRSFRISCQNILLTLRISWIALAGPGSQEASSSADLWGLEGRGETWMRTICFSFQSLCVVSQMIFSLPADTISLCGWHLFRFACLIWISLQHCVED